MYKEKKNERRLIEERRLRERVNVDGEREGRRK